MVENEAESLFESRPRSGRLGDGSMEHTILIKRGCLGDEGAPRRLGQNGPEKIGRALGGIALVHFAPRDDCDAKYVGVDNGIKLKPVSKKNW